MAHEKILIVEDDKDILELVAYNLQKDGYITLAASTGEDALRMAASFRPDLVLLDIMLPGIDGLEICKELKRGEQTSTIPVIMVTAKSGESDIISGLELGAEDYLTKPFSPKVLIARIRSVLRRTKAKTEMPPGGMLRVGGISIDVARHQVTCEGIPVFLSATEFALLHFLALKPGWVFSRSRIIGAVKGDDYPVTDRSVDVQILGLRKKLGKSGNQIQTVRGVGYRLTAD